MSHNNIVRKTPSYDNKITLYRRMSGVKFSESIEQVLFLKSFLRYVGEFIALFALYLRMQA